MTADGFEKQHGDLVRLKEKYAKEKYAKETKKHQQKKYAKETKKRSRLKEKYAKETKKQQQQKAKKAHTRLRREAGMRRRHARLERMGG